MEQLQATVAGAVATLFDKSQELYPFFQQTVVLPTFGLDAHFDNLAEVASMDVKTVKYLVGLLAVYPFCFVFSAIKSPTLKHAISVFFGIWLEMFIFAHDWAHSLVSSLVALILMKVLPAKMAPRAVFIWMMAYMSLSHMYRMYSDYLGWTLDFTGPQMILTQKLTAMAWNIYDGQNLQKERDAANKKGYKDDRAKQRAEKQFANRERYAIPAVPSILEYFGYVYCFPTILAGPAFEYKLYLEGVEAKTSEKKPVTVLNCAHVGTAFWCLAQAIVHVAFFQVVEPMIPLKRLWLEADTFQAMPFFQRWAFSWGGLFMLRQRYYFAWMISEGAVVAAGFGYDEVKGKSTWRGVRNIDVIGFEAATTTSEASRSWNMRTQQWLERYVYIRNNSSLVVTYAVSAFWHGFYPGYYFFFLSVALWTVVERKYLAIIDGALGKNVLTKFLKFVLLTTTMNYMVLPFIALGKSYGLTAWHLMHYWGHILLVLYYILTAVIKPPKKVSDAKKTK